MSSRPAVKTAFQNLRPTILRQPARSVVTPEAEAKLLDSTSPGSLALEASTSRTTPEIDDSSFEVSRVVAAPGRALLKKKKKDLLIPVTFRMPQSLKEKLERTARLHEINQTDLINEAIDLNLQRYS